MEENGGADFSELVSKILSRPDLVAELSSLAEGKPKEEETAEKPPEKGNSPTFKPQTAPDYGAEIKRRHALFGALKPYLSDGRAKLLDSMGAVLDMMETMRRQV